MLTPLISGKQPSVTLDLMMDGTQSDVFQAPFTLPLIWPTLITTGRKVVLLSAA